jgi:uncharacterized protein YjbI with pentapeptide repeats
MHVAPPQLTRDLPTLRGLRRLIEQDETTLSAMFRGDDICQLVAPSWSASELQLNKINASQSHLERTSFSDVAFANCDLIATSFPEASWRRVLIKGSRASGLQLQSSTLKDVSFVECKLNLANFRFAKLSNVVFQDCILDEVDFYAAELCRVDFRRCSLGKTQFSSARLRHVDLRTSDVLSVMGISSLSGAMIDSTQLIGLAPRLAVELKLHVTDD